MDLEPVKARLAKMQAGSSWHSSRLDGVYTADIVDDVAALVAEVERLRAEAPAA